MKPMLDIYLLVLRRSDAPDMLLRAFSEGEMAERERVFLESLKDASYGVGELCVVPVTLFGKH